MSIILNYSGKQITNQHKHSPSFTSIDNEVGKIKLKMASGEFVDATVHRNNEKAAHVICIGEIPHVYVKDFYSSCTDQGNVPNMADPRDWEFTKRFNLLDSAFLREALAKLKLIK